MYQGEQEDDEDDFDDECQNVVIQHMDIGEPLTTLRKLLEAQLGIHLTHHEFWLQDNIQVSWSFVNSLSSGFMIIFV